MASIIPMTSVEGVVLEEEGVGLSVEGRTAVLVCLVVMLSIQKTVENV